MELIIVPFILLVAVLFIFGFISASRRRKELAAWAVANGLSFSSRSDSDFDERFPDFDCLRQGHSRYAENLITGRWNEPGHATPLTVRALDYHYKTGSGKNESSHQFSAVIVENPIPMRPLLIRPENFFDRVAEFFGADDIDFESSEFSRAFFVKSPDKRWAYDVVHQRMMEFLLNTPRFALQFSPSHVIAWRDKTFDVADFGSAIRLIQGIFERLPDYVVRQQTGQL